METLKDILREEGFTFSKKYGQNFLTDANLLKAIAADAGIQPGDTVLEIGPGAGALTRQLAECAGRVVAYEIDRTLQPVLSRTLAGLSNVEVMYEDVLKADESEIFARTGADYLLVANLPYYITTPVLFRFTECAHPPRILTVMVQKEVAERLTARPGTPEYGAITASLALSYDARITRTVSRKLFTPEPNVDSAVVRLDFRPKCDRPDRVRPVIRAAFSMRRKTLANNLAAGGYARADVKTALQSMGLPADARGERLSASEFIRLTELLEKSRA